MSIPRLLSIVLLQPDTYIHIGWGLLIVLSVVVALLCWRIRNIWLRRLLPLPLLLCWFAFLWGTYVGFFQLEVRNVEYVSPDLPEAFNGYRIVHVSDIHIGSLTGSRASILERVVDSINAQQADAVCFTGDLQNKCPQEIEPYLKLLSTIKAPDGVYSVLGNHDYTDYLDSQDPYEHYTNMGRSISIQEDMGWRLLANSRQVIRRDSSRLVIAGMENDGEGRFPQLGDIGQTLRGISRRDFVVMLEHDPTSWRRKILPHCHAQLTLSGHTHGGQLSVFGWSPARLAYREYSGMYYAGHRALHVSNGIGGVIPFRLGAPAEITVITLKRP
jgi:hypothetical protein